MLKPSKIHLPLSARDSSASYGHIAICQIVTLTLPWILLFVLYRAPASLVQTKLIKTSSLHSRLPRIQHAYAWPFFFLYPAWSFIYFFRYDEWIKSEEITFVTLGLLLTTNAMLFLTCQWSVSVKAALTCRKVSNPISLTLITLYFDFARSYSGD